MIENWMTVAAVMAVLVVDWLAVESAGHTWLGVSCIPQGSHISDARIESQNCYY